MLSEKTKKIFGDILYDILPEGCDVKLDKVSGVEEEFSQKFTILQIPNYIFELNTTRIEPELNQPGIQTLKIWLKDDYISEHRVTTVSDRAIINLVLIRYLTEYNKQLRKDLKSILGKLSKLELKYIIKRFYNF